MLPFILGDEKAWEAYPNLKRLTDEIMARPAAKDALALKDKHKFKADMDEAARAVMFKHLKAS
jgi:GST-like protein